MSDWSSDVCSSDLLDIMFPRPAEGFVIDEVHAREFGGVDRFQFPEAGSVKVMAALDSGGRAVGELGLRCGTVALVEPERGREFGVLIDEHVVDALVDRGQIGGAHV